LISKNFALLRFNKQIIKLFEDTNVHSLAATYTCNPGAEVIFLCAHVSGKELLLASAASLLASDYLKSIGTYIVIKINKYIKIKSLQIGK
jgi:hypothetical protein